MIQNVPYAFDGLSLSNKDFTPFAISESFGEA